MADPKSHLVERVAERLLQSGALEESAAHLLGPGRATPADPAPVARIGRGAEPATYASPASEPAIRPEPGSAAGIVLLDRLPVPDEAAASLAVPGILRGPEPSEGLRSIDAAALERAGMADWSRTRSRVSEEFRQLQRQILRNAFAPPGAERGFTNLLMIASARPGEGKSFTAVNLAGSIARQGSNHVLLVDADSKRDSICYPMGLADAPGLLDLAADPALDPGPLIVRTPIDKLSILPIGRDRERSPVLFSSQDMTRLIQNLGRRYADCLVVLDTPPCLSTSDPAVLATVVGQILFVVEAERTRRGEIEASLDLLQACPTIALLLNKQQVSSRYGFGAYPSSYSS
jgi:protein-tyrosine kinase